jgi:hypothetical protein
MRLTESQLKQIVQEEIDQMIEEGWLDRMRARMSGAGRGGRAAGERVSGAGQAVAGGLKHLATGGGVEAVGASGSVRGAYAAGKAGKIILLHQQKLQKVMGKAQAGIQDRLDDFKNDIEKLGLDKAKTDVFQDLYNDITEIAATLSPAGPLGKKLAAFSEEAAAFEGAQGATDMAPEKTPKPARARGGRMVGLATA